MRIALSSTLLLSAFLMGCPPKDSDTDMDTDGDTFDPGTDMGTEEGTDADSDSDSDSESDTDTEGPNLLTNEGFESATAFEGWAIFPDSLTNRSITTTARTGSSAARLFSRGFGETPVFQQFAATPGDCYTMTGWIYNPASEPLDANTEAWLALKFFTSDFGGFSGQESTRITSATATDTWTEVSVSGEVPSGFAFVQAALEYWECPDASRRGCSGGGAAYFDDIDFFASPGACSE